MTNSNKIHDLQSNIRVFQKKRRWNIGIILFGIIFIYLVMTVLLYLTTPKVSRYEVRIGSILNDTAYTGIALREETVVKSDAAGYINYYAGESSKVKVGTSTHTISENRIETDGTKEAEESSKQTKELTEEQQNNFYRRVQSFSEDFDSSSFDEVYSFKNSTNETLDTISNENKVAGLNQLLKENPEGITLEKAADDGILVYETDGYEDVTKETITEKHFDKSAYVKTEFQNNSKISAGDPVYKLVTSEDWSLVIPIDKKMKKELEDRKSIRVRFEEDDEIVRAGLELLTKGKETFAVLSFDNSLVRYISQRFIDIELILEDQTGLKIPKSAKVEKDFYVVPQDYITQGGNSKGDGVLRKTENRKSDAITEFMNVTVYYSEDGMVYLDPEDFEKGDVLVKPESSETYTLKKTEKLDGVFQINKGYAEFKQIKILCESDEYYIVESGNRYGLSNYDYIALTGSSVKENDIVAH